MKLKKIKILYTIPNFDTAGSGKVVYDLVKNIDRNVFEPHICCFHTEGDFFREIQKLKCTIHVFPFAINYRPFITFPFRLFKTIQFFKKNKFDLIHSWHWSSDFSEPLAAKLARIPFVYTKKSMGWGNKAWKWRSDLSSKIIAINSDMVSCFFKNNIKKVIEIAIGVDTKHFFAQVKKREISKSLKFSENDFVISTVANLLPIKGIEILIKAINEINNDTVKLIIIGNDVGNYAAMLKKLAKKNSNIYFLGKKLDVRPYHAIADLFVIPTLSLGEGLPMAPLEAMASERIVIGSNVSGVKDVLKAFPNCIFEPNNVESLKDKIIEIQKLTKEEKIQLQKQMRMAVETHFSKETFIASHEKLYIDLVT